MKSEKISQRPSHRRDPPPLPFVAFAHICIRKIRTFNFSSFPFFFFFFFFLFFFQYFQLPWTSPLQFLSSWSKEGCFRLCSLSLEKSRVPMLGILRVLARSVCHIAPPLSTHERKQHCNFRNSSCPTVTLVVYTEKETLAYRLTVSNQWLAQVRLSTLKQVSTFTIPCRCRNRNGKRGRSTSRQKFANAMDTSLIDSIPDFRASSK